MRLSLRFIILVVAVALVVSTVGRAEPPPSRFSHEHISVAEWQTYLDEVKSVPDVRCEDTKRFEHYCTSDSLTSIWVFTEPGHPAHPAVSTGVFYMNSITYGILNKGYFAGDEAAFRAWAAHALGDLLILDKWRQHSSKGGT